MPATPPSVADGSSTTGGGIWPAVTPPPRTAASPIRGPGPASWLDSRQAPGGSSDGSRSWAPATRVSPWHLALAWLRDALQASEGQTSRGERSVSPIKSKPKTIPPGLPGLLRPHYRHLLHLPRAPRGPTWPRQQTRHVLLPGPGPATQAGSAAQGPGREQTLRSSDALFLLGAPHPTSTVATPSTQPSLLDFSVYTAPAPLG